MTVSLEPAPVSVLNPSAMYAGSQPFKIRYGSGIPPGSRLILFGRYPVPGRAKTRLIPALGPVGAADLQRRLTRKCLAVALTSGLPASSIEFCYTGGSRAQMKRWLGHTGISFSPQSGTDLGTRMHNALSASFCRGYRQTVLVGTDIPAMTTAHLQRAFRALDSHDLVLGPSNDGGYWLIGANRPADVFRQVPWGRPGVLARTLEQASCQELSVARIDTLDDIDTEGDLSAWQPDGDWRNPYLTVVIPALDEAKGIASTVRRSVSPDSEIIVADGGSRDNTASLARSAGARVIHTSRGRAVQQNAAARTASGRVLLFVHADTALPSDYPAQVFETLMPFGTSAGAFRFKTDLDHWSMRLIEKTVHIRSTLFQMPYGDQGLFMYKRIFNGIGGFPKVPIAEDLFLVRRLARLGRIAQARSAAVTSARRWRAIGIWRATVLNYLIAGGCLAGIDLVRLAPLYRLRLNPKKGNHD